MYSSLPIKLPLYWAELGREATLVKSDSLKKEASLTKPFGVIFKGFSSNSFCFASFNTYTPVLVGAGALPSLGTDQLAVSIGGIRAMYGDLTGGAFSYTSKSATEKVVGILEGISSTGLDPYGYNTLEGFVSGPLWVKKDVKQADGTRKNIVKLGYTMNANIGYFVDPAPTALIPSIKVPLPSGRVPRTEIPALDFNAVRIV